MKKGIYYVPLFLILLFNIGVSWYIESWYTLVAWIISLLFLCEIYFLRFFK
jgi:hypothetical protein